MSTKVVFESSQIAPCGMNCGSCLGYLRERNRCPGCRIIFNDKAKSRVNCIIRNCPRLAGGTSGFCYECEKFPCRRMKDLDKRYRTKYRTSLIENLQMISAKGIGNFLEFEAARRTCPSCGTVLCVHRVNCPQCNYAIS
jgi:hypothetical protein